MLDEEVKALVLAVGMPASCQVTAPLKGTERVYEKCADKYAKRHPMSDGAAMVLDVVRCSVICPTEEQLMLLLELFSDSRFTIVRLKNLFVSSGLDAAHYRRLMLNVAVELPSNASDGGMVVHLCEVQLFVAGIYYFKEQNAHLSHGPYEYFRSLLKTELKDVLESSGRWMELDQRMKQLGSITQVPVTLALLVVVMEDASGAGRPTPLPSSVFDLYHQATATILAQACGSARQSDIELMSSALAACAVANQLVRRRVFSGADVNAALGAMGKTGEGEGAMGKTGEAARALWWSLVDTQGTALPMVRTLTVPADPDNRDGYEFQFVHLSLQEYYMAANLAQGKSEGEGSPHAAVTAVHEAFFSQGLGKALNQVLSTNVFRVGGGVLGRALVERGLFDRPEPVVLSAVGWEAFDAIMTALPSEVAEEGVRRLDLSGST